MSWKMHLIARVPNEGARRLAWWLATHPGGVRQALTQLARRAAQEELAVDRLLRGELIPGADMAWAISVVTAGAVRTSDWRDPARGSWGARPAGAFGPEPKMLSPNRALAIGDAWRGCSAPGGWQQPGQQNGRGAQAEARA